MYTDPVGQGWCTQLKWLYKFRMIKLRLCFFTCLVKMIKMTLYKMEHSVAPHFFSELYFLSYYNVQSSWEGY